MAPTLEAGTTFSMSDGTTVDADVRLVAGDRVYFHLAGDSESAVVSSAKISELPAGSQATIQDWIGLNPTGVAEIKVDQPPEPIHTVAPDVSTVSTVKGAVSVALVVDTKGNVIRSFVAKTTDDRLNKPSLDAVERWKFRPGKKEGNPVVVVVFVPLQYKS